MLWELKTDRPIYSQLIEQIELRIVSGMYPAGGKLPSVNPNTMQKALSELEREGLVYSQRTSGRFITEDVTMIQKIKDNLAKQLISEFLEKMNQLGYSKKETMEKIETVLKEMK